MKKLYRLLLVLLLSCAGINTKTPEEGLVDALKDTSAERLQQGRDVRWRLASKHPDVGLYGPMAQPFNSALNSIKNTGIVPREKPSDTTPLHHWTYLCSHNSFSSGAHGFTVYRQQNLSMTEQLNRGARALMLDTWLANNAIRLTHGPPEYDRWLRTGRLFQEGMKLEKELKKLKEEFFDKPENKGEVIFIILEDYIDDRDLMDRTLEATGLASHILQPSEWDPRDQNGWPTYGWMKDHNKQLVIFSSKGRTKYCYTQWPNMYENQYGHIDDQGAAKQRGDSKKYRDRERYFYLFNFFKDYGEDLFVLEDPEIAKEVKDPIVGTIKLAAEHIASKLQKYDYSRINSSDLLSAIDYSFVNGPEDIRGRYPNFIVIDFVEKGNVYNVIDEINRKAQTNPSQFYRRIQQK